MDVTAALNPDLANELAEMAQAPSEPASDIKLPDAPEPIDTAVTLPVGLYNPVDREMIKDAEVRELTGEDEEALARITGNNMARFFQAVVERGTVRIGDKPCDRKVIENLTVADLDTLLLHIRYATYGEQLELQLVCPHCEQEVKFNLYLPDEIPVNAADETTWTVQLRNGQIATLALPTGADQRSILDGTKRTGAEMNSLLLARCIQKIDGLPIGLDAVRRLTVRDRAKLLESIGEHKAGPDLEKVRQSCPGCSEEIPLPMSMTDLFSVS